MTNIDSLKKFQDMEFHHIGTSTIVEKVAYVALVQTLDKILKGVSLQYQIKGLEFTVLSSEKIKNDFDIYFYHPKSEKRAAEIIKSII